MTTPKPGPELDARMAEVMGWIRGDPPEGVFEGCAWWRDSAGCPCLTEDDDGHLRPRYRPGVFWSPSTSIADAFEVVEKLGRYWRLFADDQHPDGVGVRAVFGADKGLRLHEAWAPTAPHAICLAALAAVEVK